MLLSEALTYLGIATYVVVKHWAGILHALGLS